MPKLFWFWFWFDVLAGPYFVAKALVEFRHDEQGWAIFHGILGWFIVVGLFRKLRQAELVKTLKAVEKAGGKDAP
jgi:hypothetical protein